MRKFDYSFLNKAWLPANLVNLTATYFSEDQAGVQKDNTSRFLLKLELLQRYNLLKVLMLLKESATSDERIAAYCNQNSALLS